MIRIVKNAYDRISIKYKKENEKVNDLKLSISEMKRKNKETGQSWFDKGAINFFCTRIEASPNAKNIFITSEWSNFNNETRKYTLRWFDTSTSEVVTLGNFQQYHYLSDAKRARKEMVIRDSITKDSMPA